MVAVGIFYPIILHAIQVRKDDLTASPIYDASFNFSSREHSQPRAHVVPARFYFTATDSEHVYNLSPGTTAYSPPWHENYTTASWSNKLAYTPSTLYDLAFQVSQIRKDTLTDLPPYSYITGQILLGGDYDLIAKTFKSSPAPFFTSASTTELISKAQDSKPFAMIQSRSRVYFFWLETGNMKYSSTIDGYFTASPTVTAPDLSTAFGLSGCILKSGTSEHIAVTYAKSPTQFNILTFIDGDYPNTKLDTITLESVNSPLVSIAQNPRTGKVLLTWISVNTGYYRIYDFDGLGSFTQDVGTTAIGNGFATNRGTNAEGYINFESTFALPTATAVNSYSLKSAPAAHDVITPNGYAVQFPFFDPVTEKHYAGLVNYRYADYEFYRHELKFPDEGRWDKTSKTLHLEGPPWPNTLVQIEYEFTEVATDACLVHMVNANGGRRPFNNETGVIASNSSLFTVEFDYNMDQTLYSGYMNNKIRMFDSINNVATISYATGTANSISFRPDDDLSFNTGYRIEIASDVIDARGTQIWEPITLNFTTQKSSSSVIASEVKNITAWRDVARTQQIASGSEASDTADIYLRLEAVDPAFNTVDTATVSILLNGAQIAQTTLTQLNYTSNYFDGYYKLATPLATDSVYTFKAHPDSATTTNVIVTYPTFSPIYPLPGATNVPGLPTIRVKTSESILPVDISSTKIKLLKGVVATATTLLYNDATHEISITPTTTLESETTYTVSISGLRDVYYNTQKAAFSYQFTVADIKPPEVTPASPNNGETGVTIDRHIVFNISEALAAATVNKTSVKLTRAGIPASYSIILSGSKITIDPDDAPDGGLEPQTTYVAEVTTAVTDLAGNNLPAAKSISFTTQPYSTPPTAISNITLYKDPLLITGWGLYEKIPASATVYIKVIGTDGATQTRDLATASLNFSWGAPQKKISLLETASNSTGIYFGNFNFGSTLFGFPNPPPPASIGSLTFSVDLDPADAATLTVTFPALVPAETLVNSTSGQVVASNASNVRIDSNIVLSFSDQLLDGGNPVSLSISSGAVPLAGTRTLSADRRKITFTPDSPLPYSSKITVSAPYDSTGLKSMQGNPLYQNAYFTFTTQPAQTPPVSITQVNLFPDASYSSTNSYESNDDFPRSGTMYVEARGPDAASNTVDFTTVNISTGASLQLNETSAGSGIYRGIYNYPSQTNGFAFIVSSAVTPAASRTLILSIPSLAPSIPASASTDVSINTSVRAKGSEDLDPTTINSSNVKLFKGGVEVAGAVSYIVSEKEIVFTPLAPLATSTVYVYSMSGIKDLVGNNISSNLVVSFTTQAVTTPPIPPITLKVYANSDYTGELAGLAYVIPGSQVFAEITATDMSATTIDSTLIEQKSNMSGATTTYTLLETATNTGILRASITIFNEENALIILKSLTDLTKTLSLNTYAYPKILTLSPVSGTANVYLNQTFTITTNKNVAAASLSTSTIRLSDSSGAASYSLSLSNPTTITINSDLEPGSAVVLRVTPGLKDINGMSFPDTIAHYSSISGSFSNFGIYSDSGFSQLLAMDAEVESGKTVYLRLDGTDTRFGEVEPATATLKSSNPDQLISLSETTAGCFTGPLIIPDLPNETVEIFPESRTDFARTLKIMPAFSLLSYSPASGAITVPADSWPTWNFTRPVRSTDITTANFALKKAIDGSLVPGTFTTSITGLQVRFQPAGLLALLTQYEMSVSATVRDNSGNVLGEGLKTRFTTQPPPAPPDENITLANYETAEYATQTFAVAYNESLYLELVAKDTSFSTYETARVRLESSDGSLDGLELTLIEIAPPSGIYRLALPIDLPPGTTIKIQSQGDPTKVITITARVRTAFVSMDPASGSTNLYLDQPITLTFNHSLDRTSAANGFKMLASDTIDIPLRFAWADSDHSIIITPDVAYASSSRHSLQRLTNLRDSNGLFLLPDTAWLTTRGPASATLDLLTGIAPRTGQSVSLYGEATPGNLVVLATTTNMFETYSETRTVQINTASGSNLVTLAETAPGSFRGEYSLAADIVGDINAALLFAGVPSLTFPLAPQPEVVSVIPASGSSGVAELPAISATFSRRLAFESSADALRILTDAGNIVTGMTSPAADSITFNWQPLSPLPLQSTCTLQLSGLTDYLGQSLPVYQHPFMTGGRQGINLFSDDSFAQLIATNQVDIPVVFVEVAASGTLNLTGRTFDLLARTGTRATSTVKLQLEAYNPESGRFRCSLEFEPGKAVPQYPLALLPGEWLEMTSPILTDDVRLIYYKHSGSASPVNILGISLYSEKNFAQRVTDTIANPSLFIEIEAEDLNWFTTDTTRIKIYSEADQAGMLLDLVENGTHSSQFRNFVRLSRDNSDPAINNLKVLPAQRIYIESVTDPAVKTSILYLPVNTIKMMSVYPSPARGSKVNFRFYLNFPTYVDLKIYDTAGHEIYSTGIRGVEGENVYEWRLPRKMANGTYFYTVKIDNESGFPDAKRRVRGKFAILR